MLLSFFREIIFYLFLVKLFILCKIDFISYSSGPSIDGCRTKIFNPDSDGEGEIIMSSRNIMMGYLFNEDKTKEAIDENGWLHSGDLGTELDDGYFKVTGRLKELIITAGGMY